MLVAYPGWGGQGATTHWQHWDGDPDYNQAMFWSIEEFLFNVYQLVSQKK